MSDVNFAVKVGVEDNFIVFETTIGLIFALEYFHNTQDDFSRFMLMSHCCASPLLASSSTLGCQRCGASSLYGPVSPFYRTPLGLQDATSAVQDWGIKSESFSKTANVQVLEAWVAPFGDTFSQILWARELERYLEEIYGQVRIIKTDQQLAHWLKTIEC